MGASVLAIDVAAVVFREDLYPRIETSPITVQKYAEDLDVLPPIEINQRNELIDGWHRWTAHKKVGATTIRVIMTQTSSDDELDELAVERNASHGLSLSIADKERRVGRWYSRFLSGRPNAAERAAYKERLAKLFSASLRSIERWTARDDKDFERETENAVWAAWLGCEPQDSIAEAAGWSQPKVAEFIKKRQLSFSDNASAAHRDEAFHPPLYNVWKQQEKTNGSRHPGNSEVRWVDNLLYLYTQPFDVVVDPFAGGGSTIDICKKRFRRYWVSDRKPVVERENEIRKHDLTDGLPSLPRWKDVRLVYLDPPYWKQAEGEYSQDAADFANMALDEFTDRLAGTINDFAKKLSAGAAIALILQPTQWRAPERQYTDHVADMLKRVKAPIDLRIQCPYESQQCTAQMVEWAKANRKVLVLSREIVVWRVT